MNLRGRKTTSPGWGIIYYFKEQKGGATSGVYGNRLDQMYTYIYVSFAFRVVVAGFMLLSYSIVKDSSADLGVNSKIVQIRPTVKAVGTKMSKFLIF